MQPEQNYNPNPMPTPQPIAPSQPAVNPLGNGYDFLNTPTPNKNPILNLGGTSKLGKIFILLVGLVVIIIIFAIIKSIFTVSPFAQTDWLKVVYRQDEIIHILSNDIQTSQEQSNLNLNDQNFASTASLVLANDQSKTLLYLKNNRVKLNKNITTLVITTNPDSQLTNALQTNNFDQVFKTVMLSELQIYETKLISAYKTTHGVKGKALLTNNYNNAQLLIKQLGSTTN